MTEFLSAYGLFLAELLTVALVVVAIVALVASSRRGGHPDGLTVEHLNKRFEDAASQV